MRNLIQYPITYDEKIKLLNEFISFRRKLTQDQGNYGDMTVATLAAILKDVEHIQENTKERV